jgi:hypothetical protein
MNHNITDWLIVFVLLTGVMCVWYYLDNRKFGIFKSDVGMRGKAGFLFGLLAVALAVFALVSKYLGIG